SNLLRNVINLSDRCSLRTRAARKKNQRGKAGFINKTNGSLGSNRLALVLCWFKHPFLCSPCRGIVQRENRFYDPDTRSPSRLLNIGNHNHRPPRNGIKRILPSSTHDGNWGSIVG